MKNIIKKIKSFFETFGDGDWFLGVIVLSSTTLEFCYQVLLNHIDDFT